MREGDSYRRTRCNRASFRVADYPLRTQPFTSNNAVSGPETKS